MALDQSNDIIRFWLNERMFIMNYKRKCCVLTNKYKSESAFKELKEIFLAFSPYVLALSSSIC